MCGSTPMIVTVFLLPPMGKGDHGRQADFGNPIGVTPLLSQTAAGHQPGDTPWESQPLGAAGDSRVIPTSDLRNATGHRPREPLHTYKSAVQSIG